MFDSDILCGIRGVLVPLHRPVELRSVVDSSSETGKHMVSVLEQIASCNPNITVSVQDGESAEGDSVRIIVDGVDSGIEFRAIPDGNMLGAFLHAILNCSGEGFTLDKNLLERVAAIDTPLNLVTYVKKLCSQTPHALQVINELVAINPYISNTIVDAQENRDLMHRYGIERVPAVTLNDTLISEGWETPEDVVHTLERIPA